jgi:hypothetical protein
MLHECVVGGLFEFALDAIEAGECVTDAVAFLAAAAARGQCGGVLIDPERVRAVLAGTMLAPDVIEAVLESVEVEKGNDFRMDCLP